MKRYPTWDSAPTAAAKELGFSLSEGSSDNKIEQLTINPHSGYFPSEKSEPLAWSILTLHPHVCLWRVPRDPPRECNYWKEDADLKFLTASDPNHGGYGVSVNTSTFNLKVHDAVTQDANFTSSNGKVLAVPDLLGAQLVVYLENAQPMRPILNEPGVLEEFDPGLSQANAKARSLIFEIQGRNFWLTGRALRTLVIDGRIYLSATFPATEEELRSLQR